MICMIHVTDLTLVGLMLLLLLMILSHVQVQRCYCHPETTAVMYLCPTPLNLDTSRSCFINVIFWFRFHGNSSGRAIGLSGNILLEEISKLMLLVLAKFKRFLPTLITFVSTY